MIEKPDIRDEKIITALNENYSIQISNIEFLPVGNDATAFSYRAKVGDGNSYFLKLKTNFSNPAALFVPRFLRDSGIGQVVAPVPTRTQKLCADMDGFTLILYPFIFGEEAMQVGMSDDQWTELGSVLKRIHGTGLPADISRYVRREDFVPKWSDLARDLHRQVNIRNFDARHQKELASFWREKNETIRTLIERTEAIGQHLQRADLEFVLCHSDIHTANILLTPDRNMFIVDWDEALFAPKERDLMHVLDGNSIRTREEHMFFSGYGPVEINQPALAYYRYEWCVQEIGDFGNRVFLTEKTGENTKQDAVEGFKELFSQGDVIERALNTPLKV
jgi:spectinomycin phosphotransferase